MFIDRECKPITKSAVCCISLSASKVQPRAPQPSHAANRLWPVSICVKETTTAYGNLIKGASSCTLFLYIDINNSVHQKCVSVIKLQNCCIGNIVKG